MNLLKNNESTIKVWVLEYNNIDRTLDKVAEQTILVEEKDGNEICRTKDNTPQNKYKVLDLNKNQLNKINIVESIYDIENNKFKITARAYVFKEYFNKKIIDESYSIYLKNNFAKTIQLKINNITDTLSLNYNDLERTRAIETYMLIKEENIKTENDIYSFRIKLIAKPISEKRAFRQTLQYDIELINNDLEEDKKEIVQEILKKMKNSINKEKLETINIFKIRLSRISHDYSIFITTFGNLDEERVKNTFLRNLETKRKEIKKYLPLLKDVIETPF